MFIDYEELASGDFAQVIAENITARAHFVVLVTPFALEAGMDRLRNRHLSVPLDAVLHPASAIAIKAAQHQQDAAAAAPLVEQEELAAEEWLERKPKTDNDLPPVGRPSAAWGPRAEVEVWRWLSREGSVSRGPVLKVRWIGTRYRSFLSSLPRTHRSVGRRYLFWLPICAVLQTCQTMFGSLSATWTRPSYKLSERSKGKTRAIPERNQLPTHAARGRRAPKARVTAMRISGSKPDIGPQAALPLRASATSRAASAGAPLVR